MNKKSITLRLGDPERIKNLLSACENKKARKETFDTNTVITIIEKSGNTQLIFKYIINNHLIL